MSSLLQALCASSERRAIADTDAGWTVVVDSVGMSHLAYAIFFTHVQPDYAHQSDAVRARTWHELDIWVRNLGGSVESGWLPTTSSI